MNLGYFRSTDRILTNLMVNASSTLVSRVPADIKDTQFTVKGLAEGHLYEFRVAAVNEAGVGAYAETDEAIKAEAPASKHLFKIVFDGGPSRVFSFCPFVQLFKDSN